MVAAGHPVPGVSPKTAVVGSGGAAPPTSPGISRSALLVSYEPETQKARGRTAPAGPRGVAKLAPSQGPYGLTVNAARWSRGQGSQRWEGCQGVVDSRTPRGDALGSTGSKQFRRGDGGIICVQSARSLKRAVPTANDNAILKVA